MIARENCGVRQIGEPCLPSDTPQQKLGKVLRNVEKFVERSGMDEATFEKAKMLCPDLVERAYFLADTIESEFLRHQQTLATMRDDSSESPWFKFIEKHILPYFVARLEIILAINGKFMVEDEFEFH